MNLLKYKVQTKPCTTCPFAGKNPVRLTIERSKYFYQQLLNFEGQHLCHSTNNSTICRGGRDIQLRLLFLSGIIDAPTDESFTQKINEVLNAKPK